MLYVCIAGNEWMVIEVEREEAFRSVLMGIGYVFVNDVHDKWNTNVCCNDRLLLTNGI